MPSLNTLAERVIWARHKLGLTQEDLAEKSGLSVSEIKDIESGREIEPRNTSLLARALECASTWLEFGLETTNELTNEDLNLLHAFHRLTDDEQRVIHDLISLMAKKK